MNHSVGILLFSLTTDSTQRTGLDEKSNSEAVTARWIPPFVSVSLYFLLIKESKNTIPKPETEKSDTTEEKSGATEDKSDSKKKDSQKPEQGLMKVKMLKDCQIAIRVSPLDVKS